VFGDLLPQASILASDIIGRQWMPISRTLLYFYLYAPCIFFAFQYFSSKNIPQENIQNNRFSYLSLGMGEKALLNTRFLIGCYFYVVVTALCFW